MKRCTIALLILLIIAISAGNLFALGRDFSKEQIAACGKHCVHGYEINMATFLYFAGDTNQLNHDLAQLTADQFASRKVVIHVGTTIAASPWHKQAEIKQQPQADWLIMRYDDPDDAAKAVPRMKLQVDIWLGGKIKLEQLNIPKEFEVVSGGEIEKFIRDRRGANGGQ